jgi:hypothetical protein
VFPTPYSIKLLSRTIESRHLSKGHPELGKDFKACIVGQLYSRHTAHHEASTCRLSGGAVGEISHKPYSIRADAYDAMVSPRPYRKQLSLTEALDNSEMFRHAV